MEEQRSLEIQDRWCRQIPLLHRVLSKASLPSEFPVPSRTTDLFEACSVWETLHYLLKTLLGWKRPEMGLAWWYQNGQPTEHSELLKTVREIWGRDNALDYYAAWAWSTSNPTLNGETTIDGFPTDEWWREFRSRRKPSWTDPFYGGSNPLHLGHSDHFLNSNSANKAIELFHDVPKRRAALIVNDISDWRNGLQLAERQLPDLGDRSWHVQAFDRQHGFLGTFRRSRVTGRWFQGKHRIHMAGNVGQAAKE